LPRSRIRKLLLPETLRNELKTPLGDLVKGDPPETMRRLSQIIKDGRQKFAVVGDFVAKNVLNTGLKPDLMVYDNKTHRLKSEPIYHKLYEVRVKNEPGTISEEAWSTLRRSITLKRQIAVFVEGEEDLLVLPLLAEMPIGSVIAYGQPHEGLVVVTVTEEKREWARRFLNRMIEVKE